MHELSHLLRCAGEACARWLQWEVVAYGCCYTVDLDVRQGAVLMSSYLGWNRACTTNGGVVATGHTSIANIRAGEAPARLGVYRLFLFLVAFAGSPDILRIGHTRENAYDVMSSSLLVSEPSGTSGSGRMVVPIGISAVA